MCAKKCDLVCITPVHDVDLYVRLTARSREFTPRVRPAIVAGAGSSCQPWIPNDRVHDAATPPIIPCMAPPLHTPLRRYEAACR